MLKNKKINIYYFIFSMIIIFITSQFSPLYIYDKWSDPGCFYTVGSGIMHGLVPYKDLFEQKGPLLYFIYAIASTIKPKWNIFLGGYILETLVLFFSMLILQKIALYITNNKKISFCSALLLPVVQCSGIVGVNGGVPEDISIPLILGLILFTLKLINNNYNVSFKSVFIQGILFGCVFWMKYTLVGAWLCIGLITIIFLIMHCKYKKIFTYLISSLSGFLVVTIPIIIYFGINNAIGDLWQTYFCYNIGFYHDSTPFIIKLLQSIFYTLAPWADGFSYGIGGYINNSVWFLLIIIQFISIFSNVIVKKWSQKFVILAMLVFNGVLEYWGGYHWSQYKLILIPFISFSFVWLCNLFLQKFPKFNYFSCGLVVLISVLIFNGNIRGRYSKVMIFMLGNERYEQKWGDVEPVQVEFSKIMHHKYKNPTLLTYGNMSAEFYYTANIQPVNRFFVKLASTKKEYLPMMEDQNQVVKHKKVDYVICYAKSKKEFYKKYSNVLENYKLIKNREGYYLLERK